MKEYVITHLHTMNSNSILADSPSKLEDYLKEIKNKDGIRGIIRTEHGHCQNWFKTYQLMEKCNYKYIHAVEGYTCLNGDDKYNRDCYLDEENEDYEIYDKIYKETDLDHACTDSLLVFKRVKDDKLFAFILTESHDHDYFPRDMIAEEVEEKTRIETITYYE